MRGDDENDGERETTLREKDKREGKKNQEQEEGEVGSVGGRATWGGGITKSREGEKDEMTMGETISARRRGHSPLQITRYGIRPKRATKLSREERRLMAYISHLNICIH